jgi:hypothetical protein
MTKTMYTHMNKWIKKEIKVNIIHPPL